METLNNYECKKCNDTELIFDSEKHTATPCECQESKKYKRLYEKSGITKAFSKKTFENFETNNKPNVVKQAKVTAQKFVEKYSHESSIAFLGQVGAGKTHLCIAIANELLKRNIGVLYMQYRDTVTNLKQNIMEEEIYQKELNKYKTATVLYIDDLFKGKLTETDINIMFEIINYRYLNELTILISSEYDAQKLIEFDEAIGSRIIEMCKGYIVQLEGMELNHRLIV